MTTIAAALFYLIPSIATAETGTFDYLRDLKPILARNCFSCHGGLKQEGSLRLDTVNSMKTGGDSGPAVKSGNLLESLIWERVNSSDESDRMPPEGEPLSTSEISLIRKWILDGVPTPFNEVAQSDPSQHWAFKPVTKRIPPEGTGHPIDKFVIKQLQDSDLVLSPTASAHDLIRRCYLNLHGLPPTAQETRHWTNRLATHQGFEELVDWLLDSPRYGERFAQSWLDLVRYADTHGFEVNTARPNAWPYRDFVIQSFNNDTPYDQFIRQQIAGDQLGIDAATGFLVAAPVLLPGQIGKDEPSKRLARQDALDEIITGTSATFLGLTVGCARCHDHKFDPISQRDYYSFQAFFAGVSYGDRPIMDAEHKRNRQSAQQKQQKVAALEHQLLASRNEISPVETLIIDDEDMTHVTILKEKKGHGTNPDGTQRGYRQDKGDGSRVPNLSGGRYTWWANHPDEDVFTWNPTATGQYRVWISWGVHGSGVHTRDANYVLDRDGDLSTRGDQTIIAKADQFYYSGQTEGDSEKTPRWSGLKDAGIHHFEVETKIILRGGSTGSGITADSLVLQRPSAESISSRPLPLLNEPVAFDRNVEVFTPRDVKYLRFTSLNTHNQNQYEPCLDELEAYSAEHPATNLALATAGTVVTSSGNLSESGRHQLKHVHDGKYGNDHSWISDKKGQGWVQLQFPQTKQISRVVWSRDRNGKFKDRLPIDYRIEVSTDNENWTLVANSKQRLPFGTAIDPVENLVRNAPVSDQIKLRDAFNELKKLRDQVKTLLAPKRIYAGQFHQPDETRLLNRGDPEQPEEIVTPAIPAVFGNLNLPDTLTESDRRMQLGNWIASDTNPLTARVMVNRIWRFHFGRGLVETTSDFGLNGVAPTHPELLDWLATYFTTSGWSVKEMHRLIMTSRVFQQASRIHSEGKMADGDCKLLWRFPSRRLEAEAIRDSMLAVSGELNLTMGGSGFDFFKSRGGLTGFPPIVEFSPAQLRRMIYAHKVRMETVPIFGAFDCPDAGQPMPQRASSTTAIQALNLFNSKFVFDRAIAVSSQVDTNATPTEQINSVFRLMLGRDPSNTELEASRQTVQDSSLPNLSRVLFNSNEFLFIP